MDKLPINEELSLDVARRIQAKPKACWRNSVLGLTYLANRPDNANGPPLYVEGWVVNKELGLAFEHGWLIFDGQIVEPTLILIRVDELRNGRYIYFAGICYTSDEVNRQIEIQHERAGDDNNGDINLPFAFWNIADGGLTAHDYRRAWKAAKKVKGEIKMSSEKVPAEEWVKALVEKWAQDQMEDLLPFEVEDLARRVQEAVDSAVAKAKEERGLTFEEAMERLNRYDITTVAAQMADWHPAILGQMLLAVAVAKLIRYAGPHPDYTEPAVAVVKTAGETVTIGQLIKQNTGVEAARINLAVKRLEKCSSKP